MQSNGIWKWTEYHYQESELELMLDLRAQQWAARTGFCYYSPYLVNFSYMFVRIKYKLYSENSVHMLEVALLYPESHIYAT